LFTSGIAEAEVEYRGCLMQKTRDFLGRKKRTHENPDREIPLVRALGLVQTVFLGVGTAIGGVLLAVIGTAANAARAVHVFKVKKSED
jgi:hypothetical protein